MPFVSELYSYPLKSGKGISYQELVFTPRGPSFDRQWMVINNKNRFITQRQKARMCLIETSFIQDILILNAPGMSTLRLSSYFDKINVVVWKDTVSSYDCGDEAAIWISRYLNTTGCRIVTMPKSTQRLVDTNYAQEQQTVSFADGFPSLITSQASLDDFNQKLASPISMMNFRPNIVIGGCEPYAEDRWKELRINGIHFSLVKPCSRCVIPSIDPETGSKQHDILHALNKYRRRENATYFGQNALHDKSGAIRVGDSVEIIA